MPAPILIFVSGTESGFTRRRRSAIDVEVPGEVRPIGHLDAYDVDNVLASWVLRTEAAAHVVGEHLAFAKGACLGWWLSPPA
jgi:hypothetical protein